MAASRPIPLIRRRRFPITFAFAFLALAPLCLLTLLSIRLGDEAVRSEVQARISGTDTAAAALIDQQMQDLSALVSSYAGRADLAAALSGGSPTDSALITSTLGELQRSQQGIAADFVTDAGGRLLDVLPATPSIVGESFRSRDWFVGVLGGSGTYISTAYRTAATGHARVVAAAALIRGPSTNGELGPVVGILVAEFNLSTIQSFVNHFATANNVAVSVTDQSGTLIAAPGEANAPGQLISERGNPAIAAALEGQTGTMEVGQGSAGVLAAYTQIADNGWAVTAQISTDMAFASSRHLRNTVATIAVLLGLILLFGCLLFARSNRRRARAERRLAESEGFLDTVIENMPDMVFIKDAEELRFVRVNRAIEQVLGVPREELISKNDYDLAPREAAASSMEFDRAVLAQSGVVDVPEDWLETKDGRRILHTKKMPIFDSEGATRYLLGISEDVTERHADQLALVEAKEEAERANQAKNTFLSRTSHELRTPLNAVIGFSQLLEMSDLSEIDRDNNHHILKAGRHLLTLINELIDLSRIESRELSLSLEPVSLVPLIADVVELMAPLAAARSISIEQRTTDEDLEARVDRQRLLQILLNLVSNAVKYNREGGTIEIVSRLCDDSSVEVCVVDTGPGLSTEDLEKIFLPFERLQAEGTAIEGTGIGLTLSAALAQAMGAEITVESELGRGTTFVVRMVRAGMEDPLDVDVPDLEEPTPSVEAGTAAFHILYVEDNLANIQIVERYLQGRSGVVLQSAMSGQLGVDLARQHHQDLVLLDLHLPDLTGEEVYERLRADPQTATIPIVMISADATRGRVERLLARGVYSYLTKPIDLVELGEIIDALQRAEHQVVTV